MSCLSFHTAGPVELRSSRVHSTGQVGKMFNFKSCTIESLYMYTLFANLNKGRTIIIMCLYFLFYPLKSVLACTFEYFYTMYIEIKYILIPPVVFPCLSLCSCICQGKKLLSQTGLLPLTDMSAGSSSPDWFLCLQVHCISFFRSLYH